MLPRSPIVIPSTPFTTIAANEQFAVSADFWTSTENFPVSACLFVHCACAFCPLPTPVPLHDPADGSSEIEFCFPLAAVAPTTNNVPTRAAMIVFLISHLQLMSPQARLLLTRDQDAQSGHFENDDYCRCTRGQIE